MCGLYGKFTIKVKDEEQVVTLFTSSIMKLLKEDVGKFAKIKNASAYTVRINRLLPMIVDGKLNATRNVLNVY
jgi:hypothetical protein